MDDSYLYSTLHLTFTFEMNVCPILHLTTRLHHLREELCLLQGYTTSGKSCVCYKVTPPQGRVVCATRLHHLRGVLQGYTNLREELCACATRLHHLRGVLQGYTTSGKSCVCYKVTPPQGRVVCATNHPAIYTESACRIFQHKTCSSNISYY